MDMYLAHGAGDDGISTVLVLLAVAFLILGLVVMLARIRLGPSPVEEPEELQDL